MTTCMVCGFFSLASIGMHECVCGKCQKKYLIDKFGNILEPELKIDSNGTKHWYVNGKLHRLNGPAVERTDGAKLWYVNNKRHRLDGPAIEYAYGEKYWYVNDKLHRLNGPAIEYANGEKYWYVNDKLHRLNGPAVEWSDGRKEYYIEGEKYSYEDWKKKVKQIDNESL